MQTFRDNIDNFYIAPELIIKFFCFSFTHTEFIIR